MVSDAWQPANAGFLNGNGQQAAEDTFDCSATIIVFFENFRSVRDLIADVVGDTPEIVAALLVDEFRMADRAKQQVGFFGSLERTAILYIGDAFDCHATMAIHTQVGWTKDILAIATKTGLVLSAAWIVWNKRLGLKRMDDVPENGFRVVFGVATDGFEIQIESSLSGIEQRDSHGWFADRIWFGDFPYR